MRWLSRSRGPTSGSPPPLTPPSPTPSRAPCSHALACSAASASTSPILSYAKPLYDSIASSGGDVSQSDRLGDTIINLDSKTGRHNKFNRAFYNAVSAQATTSVILGDKGDGSPRARVDALARYAHYSADHVPDIIEQQAAKNGNAVLYESKCWTQLKTSDNLGGGTPAGGGSPSTAMGHLVAFGGTEETLLHQNIGCKARGDAARRPVAGRV